MENATAQTAELSAASVIEVGDGLIALPGVQWGYLNLSAPVLTAADFALEDAV